MERWQESLAAGISAIRCRSQNAGMRIGGPATDTRWDMSLVEVHERVGDSTIHSVRYVAWTWPDYLRGRRVPTRGKKVMCVVPAAMPEDKFNTGDCRMTVIIPAIGLKPHRKRISDAPEVHPDIHQLKLMAEVLQQRQFADEPPQLAECQLCGQTGPGPANAGVTTCTLCLGNWHPPCCEVVRDFFRNGCQARVPDVPFLPVDILDFVCGLCACWHASQ